MKTHMMSGELISKTSSSPSADKKKCMYESMYSTDSISSMQVSSLIRSTGSIAGEQTYIVSPHWYIWETIPASQTSGV